MKVNETPKSLQTQKQQPSELEKKVAQKLFANKSMEWVISGKDSWITFVRAAFDKKDITWNQFLNFVFNITLDFNKIKDNVLNAFADIGQSALDNSEKLVQKLEVDIAAATSDREKKK